MIRAHHAAALLFGLLLLVAIGRLGLNVLIEELPKHHGGAALALAHPSAEILPLSVRGPLRMSVASFLGDGPQHNELFPRYGFWLVAFTGVSRLCQGIR